MAAPALHGKLQTKATCKCLFGLGKCWFASLCQRSGLAEDKARICQGSIHIQCKTIFLEEQIRINFPHMYHASFSGFRNLLASRDKLWTSGSGTPQLKSKPALGKAGVLNKTS